MDTTSFLGLLQGVKKSGSGWQAKCPAHDDRTPSLSVSEGPDGRTLLHCHGGCNPEAVCAAVGITEADLFLTKNGSEQKRIVATYPYHDASGKLLFEVVRFDPKDFRQRRPDPTALDGWTWSTKGIKKVLFRLPEILKAVGSGKFVFVTEGEKDALALVERGLAATCNPGGAGKWQENYTETLRGADCIIIPDKDNAGRDHGQLVAGKLQGAAKSLRVIELPNVDGKPVKDAADFFAAGGDAAQIAALVDAAPEWTPAATHAKAQACALPEIIDAAAFMAMPQETPPELIAGILHRVSKEALGGSSKAYKTWTLLDEAVSVAHGVPWLGFSTHPGKVLFVNFEIQPYAWQRRIAAVTRAKDIELKPGAIQLWNLRGHAADFRQLVPKIIARAKTEDFSLVVLDPLYKLIGTADENSARDIAELLNAIERLAVETGAAVAYANHFAKGLASGKETLDRISGSGVFARDPDSLLIFTKHEQPDAFTVEPILRNFPPVEPFVVRWNFPLFERADDLDPAKLKQAAGRKPENSPDDLLKLLPGKGLTNADFLAAADADGISKRTFYRLRKLLEAAGKIMLSKVNGKWKPISPKKTA
ncbi:MAG: AAA family ATPase [Verrucomicrobiota bacterium]